MKRGDQDSITSDRSPRYFRFARRKAYLLTPTSRATRPPLMNSYSTRLTAQRRMKKGSINPVIPERPARAVQTCRANVNRLRHVQDLSQPLPVHRRGSDPT